MHLQPTKDSESLQLCELTFMNALPAMQALQQGTPEAALAAACEQHSAALLAADAAALTAQQNQRAGGASTSGPAGNGGGQSGCDANCWAAVPLEALCHLAEELTNELHTGDASGSGFDDASGRDAKRRKSPNAATGASSVPAAKGGAAASALLPALQANSGHAAAALRCVLQMEESTTALQQNARMGLVTPEDFPALQARPNPCPPFVSITRLK